jgi:hypothetical protein
MGEGVVLRGVVSPSARRMQRKSEHVCRVAWTRQRLGALDSMMRRLTKQLRRKRTLPSHVRLFLVHHRFVQLVY